MNYQIREMLPEDGAQSFRNFQNRELMAAMLLLTKMFQVGKLGTINISKCVDWFW